jgi:hypothetical protein
MVVSAAVPCTDAASCGDSVLTRQFDRYNCPSSGSGNVTYYRLTVGAPNATACLFDSRDYYTVSCDSVQRQLVYSYYTDSDCIARGGSSRVTYPVGQCVNGFCSTCLSQIIYCNFRDTPIP